MHVLARPQMDIGISFRLLYFIFDNPTLVFKIHRRRLIDSFITKAIPPIPTGETIKGQVNMLKIAIYLAYKTIQV